MQLDFNVLVQLGVNLSHSIADCKSHEQGAEASQQFTDRGENEIETNKTSVVPETANQQTETSENKVKDNNKKDDN